MSKDKYPSKFSPQMEAIVLVVLKIFFTTRVLKIPLTNERAVLGNIGPRSWLYETTDRKGQYSPARLELATLVSSLTYMAQNKNYIIDLWTLPWKWSVWQNLNHEGTLNQNTHIYLNTTCTLPCNQFNTRVNYNLVVFSCHYYGARAINNGSQIKATN